MPASLLTTRWQTRGSSEVHGPCAILTRKRAAPRDRLLPFSSKAVELPRCPYLPPTRALSAPPPWQRLDRRRSRPPRRAHSFQATVSRATSPAEQPAPSRLAPT